MRWLESYIFSIIVTAVICGIIRQFVGTKGSNASLVNTLCGLAMLIVLLSPIRSISLSEIPNTFESIRTDAQQAADEGRENARTSVAEYIKRNSEAYILNKAAAMQLELAVEVKIGGSELPVPVSVTISGNISPYAKIQLQQIIENDLGIGKEEQLWI